MNIDKLLHETVERKASDLHLTVMRPPTVRVNGELLPLDYPKLGSENTAAFAQEIMTEEQWADFQERGETDFSYSIRGLSRFRVNVFRQRGTVGLVMRTINTEIPSLDKLGLPEVVHSFAEKKRGLILVTGPTGSGKSTTLASIVDLINKNRTEHILTLEDPIEFMHRHNKSIVNQREIGTDSTSFALALRSALRQDPDVILVGEMRDLETISIAITAAETGHLVMATLHTVDAPQTIDRIIDVFPSHQQQQVRVQLANTLVGILSQQLLQKTGGGRVAAVEVLVANPAVRNLIREGKIHQILSTMQTGGKLGMVTMDASLKKLYDAGQISREDTLTYSIDQVQMEKLLPGSRPGEKKAFRF
ncbi:type IV pilus twitching motility protein PilT [candidate division NPL-UPA2 bacterium]|nr:type IV pilus twitching motility protein PilT [candidate division NPL-UPA2 bacterium]